MSRRFKAKPVFHPKNQEERLVVGCIQRSNGSASLNWLIRTSPLDPNETTKVLRGLARRRVVKVCRRSLFVVDKITARHAAAGKTTSQTKRSVGKELVQLAAQEQTANRRPGTVPVGRAVVRLNAG